jgi:hypothetical protein
VEIGTEEASGFRFGGPYMDRAQRNANASCARVSRSTFRIRDDCYIFKSILFMYFIFWPEIESSREILKGSGGVCGVPVP